LAVLVAEIVLTLWDFVVEIPVRRPLGDVYAGERVTHAVMGILYGAMIACLISAWVDWWSQPAALIIGPAPVPAWLRWALLLIGFGVVLSSLRDSCAALLGLPGGG
jgi:hypothetical protein